MDCQLEPRLIFIVSANILLARFQLPGLSDRDLDEANRLSNYLELPLTVERITNRYPEVVNASTKIDADTVTVQYDLRAGTDIASFKEKIRAEFCPALTLWG